MIYTEQRTSTNLVQNVFGDWVDPNERRPPPCISIPITDEIRRLDAAGQLPRRRLAGMFCACGRKMAKGNHRGTCYLCRWHKKCREERRSRRVKCDTPGCSRLLRFGRSGGLCKTCNNKLRHPEHKRRWREKKRAQRPRQA